MDKSMVEGPQIIESYRKDDISKDWFIYDYHPAVVIDVPTTAIMNIPSMDGIGAMLAVCYNELSKQRGDHSTVWRVYPR